jgi:hypothetical protein
VTAWKWKTVQLGTFLRTTLPLGLDARADYDGGR